jgi:phospholipid/cholesterol/gamma-HCH transport system substrate-binding protein
MDDLTRRTRRPLTTDISDLNTLTGLVNKNTDILSKGLRGTPRLLDAYARSMSYGSWLNTYICSLSIRTPSGRTLDGRNVGGNTKACQ